MPLLTPIEKTPMGNEKLNRQVDQLLAAPNQVKRQLISVYKQSHALMWGEQGEVTPAQRIAKLNETAAAAELLAIAEALFSFLSTVLVGQDDTALAEITALRESTPALTINTNGTVTLD